MVSQDLKGVILAGGLGTRLYPLSKVTAKHLLPVGGERHWERLTAANKNAKRPLSIGGEPMIVHSITQLVSSGIKDILIVTNPEHVGDFVGVLGGGTAFGCELTYRVQEKARGIAHALAVAEGFAAGDRIVVYLGDNVFGSSIRPAVSEFLVQDSGARVLLKQVSDPTGYGVAVLDEHRLVGIEEKPLHPKSDYAVVGVYFYDSDVFDVIRIIEPSARGEYEITAVNNVYLDRGRLEYSIVQGDWVDAGTFDTLVEAREILR